MFFVLGAASKHCSVCVDTQVSIPWKCVMQAWGTTTRACWFLEQQISPGPSIQPSDEGTGSFTAEVLCTRLPSLQWIQIREEDLHPAARAACPRLHVQAPPGLHTQQPHRRWLRHSGQENRWVLGRRCQCHRSRCSNAAGQEGAVSDPLQTGTSPSAVWLSSRPRPIVTPVSPCSSIAVH